jgi:DNA-directed RNA polymerase II subunit RPB2
LIKDGCAPQKGTVGMTLRDSDMPFTTYGMKPDIIFNPHSLPSRMTMGVILEGLAAKTNAYKGTITDATIFNKVDIDDIAGELKKLGFNANGTERLYNGITGNYMDVEIFIAPIYYQCLQKFTIDTVYAHRETPTDALTRQPLDGKSASGGSRLGEMECSTLSTSALKTLNEKTTDHSDLYYIYVCKNCNKRAIVNEEKKIYKCVRCKDDSDIVRIKSTWSCKTLWDEIESCNIGLKFHVKESAFSKQL